jgi:hypothetical protein
MSASRALPQAASLKAQATVSSSDIPCPVLQAACRVASSRIVRTSHSRCSNPIRSRAEHCVDYGLNSRCCTNPLLHRFGPTCRR